MLQSTALHPAPPGRTARAPRAAVAVSLLAALLGARARARRAARSCAGRNGPGGHAAPDLAGTRRADRRRRAGCRAAPLPKRPRTRAASTRTSRA